jgi:hypothetical protein
MANLNAPNLNKYDVPKPEIVEGSSAPPNTEKQGIATLISSKQKKFNEIEKDFGTGGNYVENIIRNKHTIVGAATNSTPQGVVVPKGKRVKAAIAVTPTGTTSLDGGAPIVQEVDNWSAFPCGNYNVDVGNRFSVKAGGGGVHLVSGGSASLISETVTKVGSTTQTLIGGESVNVTGNSNVTIEGELVNIKSDTQVVVDSTLGVSGNVIVQGGIYSEGELFVNHITGPREIQQTIVGFTSEGAQGQLVFGSWIAGVAVIGGIAASDLSSTALNVQLAAIQSVYKPLNSSGVDASSRWPYFPDYVQIPPTPLPATYDTVPQSPPFTLGPLAAGTKVVPIKIFLGLQGTNAVQLLPHGHEFPSIPMRLLESTSKNSVNNVMRQEAIDRGINRADYSVASEAIADGPKYKKDGFWKQILASITSLFLNFPGTDKSYNVTGNSPGNAA